MSIIKVNECIYDRAQGVNYVDTVIFYADRVILSGNSGHQAFSNKLGPLGFCEGFLTLNFHARKLLAQIHLEGVVNKARAIKNLNKLGFINTRVSETVQGCDCSPTVMRKKLKSKFQWSDEEVDLLDMEDPHADMVRSVEGMVAFCEEFVLEFGK